jgi:hypothetical protein
LIIAFAAGVALWGCASAPGPKAEAPARVWSVDETLVGRYRMGTDPRKGGITDLELRPDGSFTLATEAHVNAPGVEPVRKTRKTGTWGREGGAFVLRYEDGYEVEYALALEGQNLRLGSGKKQSYVYARQPDEG